MKTILLKSLLLSLTIITITQTTNEKEMIRKSAYDVNSLILNRWSARAMSGKELSDKDLNRIFEAGRWAPSSSNNQPWRFIYAKNHTKYWDKMFNLLVPFNQSWCKNASALILVISKKTFDFNGNPSRTHSFDTGAACENMALQAADMGLVMHGMEGFDYDKARKEFNIPDDCAVEAMFALGHPASKETLSEDLQKREVPSTRKPLEQVVSEGEFKF